MGLLDFFNKLNLKELLKNFSTYVGFNGPLDVIRVIIDIGIVSFVIYKLVVLLKETRAWQLLKGLALIKIAAEIVRLLGFQTLSFLLDYVLTFSAFALVVIFQPELRRGLEHLGRRSFKDLLNFDIQNTRLKTTAYIEEIVKACTELSSNFVGALIVIERNTKVGEVINTGTELDSIVSAELLINIFTPNTPLHDGAVIIRDGKIKAAGCFLPLTDNPDISKDLGTRHRAALGISEVSDSLSVVVSEESGKISFAVNGGLTRNLTADTLRKALSKGLVAEQTSSWKISSLWKVRQK